MTRADMIESVAKRARIPVAQAELVVEEVFDCMVKAMRKGEHVELRGFGTFDVRSYGAYAGRNPMTGETIAVKPKRLPHFKAGKELASRVAAGAGRECGSDALVVRGSNSTPPLKA